VIAGAETYRSHSSSACSEGSWCRNLPPGGSSPISRAIYYRIRQCFASHNHLLLVRLPPTSRNSESSATAGRAIVIALKGLAIVTTDCWWSQIRGHDDVATERPLADCDCRSDRPKAKRAFLSSRKTKAAQTSSSLNPFWSLPYIRMYGKVSRTSNSASST
jgi:hypothetical protein